MKRILEFNNEFNAFSKDLPKEVVAFNFYTLFGEFIGRFERESSALPKANYKPIINLHGKEIEMNTDEVLYLDDKGDYLLINPDLGYRNFKK